MEPTPVYPSSQVRHRIETTDRVLRAITMLTPRQVTFFLLNFDCCFARVTGREATDTQRLVVMAALRRQACEDC